MNSITKEEAHKELGEYCIRTFAPDRVQARCAYPMYCSKHYILTLREGELVVLRTLEGTDRQEVFSRLTRRVGDLSPGKLEQLKKGLVFSDLQTMLVYMRKQGWVG